MAKLHRRNEGLIRRIALSARGKGQYKRLLPEFNRRSLSWPRRVALMFWIV
jgi:hypothetical protein